MEDADEVVLQAELPLLRQAEGAVELGLSDSFLIRIRSEHLHGWHSAPHFLFGVSFTVA